MHLAQLIFEEVVYASYNARRQMPHFFTNMVSWLADYLPGLSGFVLLVVGLIMCFPGLAERIENHKPARNIFVLLCFSIALGGYVGQEYQRKQFDTKINKLVGDNSTLVASTNLLVTNVSLIAPQIQDYKDQIVDYNKRIIKAKEAQDSSLVASLQSQVEAVRKEQEAAQFSLVLSLVPGVVTAMNEWDDKWDSEDRTATRPYEIGPGGRSASEAEKASREGELQKTRLDLASRYAIWIKPIMTTADNLRKELLSRLPGTQITAADTNEASVFSKAAAGETISYKDLRNAAAYLDALARRVGTPYAPVLLKADAR